MGASLLAKAIDQSTLMLNVIPLSRASSLPQFFACISRPHVMPQASSRCVKLPPIAVWSFLCAKS
ncbi:hypothetical protein FGA82_26300 [Pseudomonas fluorescens]|nr:hypothetical protein FGA82_26300 [Pseudomonas fluorescens]